MRGWGPAEPPRPQAYHVACASGHRLHGERGEGYQALRCPTCGEGIFVLPRSPLPDPPAPETREPSRGKGRPAASPVGLDDGPIPLIDPPAPRPIDDVPVDDDEIEWLEPESEADEPAASKPAPREESPPVRVAFDVESVLADEVKAPPAAVPSATPTPQPARVRAAANRPRRPPADRPERPTIAIEEPGGYGAWARRHRHALIFVGVAILVVGTVGMQLRRQRRQALPGIVERGRIEGLPALDAGEFDVARRILGEAARSVDALGGAVEGASEVRQGAAEAGIFVDLIPTSLEELVGEAARAENERAWAERFESLYRGRSILLDGQAAEYRILTRSGLNSNRVGRIETEGFPLLEPARPGIVIGARLESVGLVEGVWRVGLDPESGVVMTHWDALRAFGWPVEETGPRHPGPGSEESP